MFYYAEGEAEAGSWGNMSRSEQSASGTVWIQIQIL